jgi:hypothetical protein
MNFETTLTNDHRIILLVLYKFGPSHYLSHTPAVVLVSQTLSLIRFLQLCFATR